jgi:DNA-directed RNA polymerase subunit RPC12/RpoP
MSRIKENTSFICEHCGKEVLPLSNGSYRNHCPYCLYSKHVDIIPGDRLNPCKGLMKPMGIKTNTKKGFQIIHKCLNCGQVKVNRIAENTNQPDDIEKIIKLTENL